MGAAFGVFLGLPRVQVPLGPWPSQALYGRSIVRFLTKRSLALIVKLASRISHYVRACADKNC
jgi:hypothetical protein